MLALLFLGHYTIPAASSSRLISAARIAAQKQSLLYPAGRTAVNLGKRLGASQPVYGYNTIRPLSTSQAPHFFNNTQKYLSNMARSIPSGFGFWQKQTIPQPINLTSIRSEIHAAHEFDNQGNIALPRSTKAKIKQLLDDTTSAESLVSELNAELIDIREKKIDLEGEKSWYQERGALKLWQAKIKELQDESYELELIKQFTQQR